MLCPTLGYRTSLLLEGGGFLNLPCLVTTEGPIHQSNLLQSYYIHQQEIPQFNYSFNKEVFPFVSPAKNQVSSVVQSDSFDLAGGGSIDSLISKLPHPPKKKVLILLIALGTGKKLLKGRQSFHKLVHSVHLSW